MQSPILVTEKPCNGQNYKVHVTYAELPLSIRMYEINEARKR